MWNQRYAAPGYFYGTAPNDFLVEQARLIPRGRVLELAAGEGRNGVWLAQQGYAVTCVDGSDVGLAKARELARERGVQVETVVADLGAYAVEPNAWDGIVSIWCHLPHAIRARLHGQCVTGLKPGGVLLLEAYTPAQIPLGTGGPKDAGLLPTLAMLKDELKGLELVVGVEREREVHEGAHHEGRSAVVQLLARKPA